MTRAGTALAVALAALAACARAPVGPAIAGLHADPSALVADASGRRVFVACGPQRAVAVVDVADRELVAMRDVGGRPHGVALSRDGTLLAVSLPDEDAVALFDADTPGPGTRIAVGVEPAGLAFDRAGARLFVANARSGDVSVVDVLTRAEVGRTEAGREPWAVVLSPDGATVAVVSRMAGVGPPDREPRSEVTLLDAADGRVRRRVSLPSCHLSQGAAFTPDGRRLLVPAVRVRNLLPIVQVDRGWVMSTVLATVDVATGGVALLPLNEPCEGFPDPSGIAVTPDGKRAFVASATTDRICEVRLDEALRLEGDAAAGLPERLSLTRRYAASRFAVGAGPCGVAVAGGVVAVAERLGDAVSFVAEDGSVAARVRLVPPVPDDAVRRGDRVFHDARYAFQSAFSCSSCHPGAHTDGLAYDFEIDGIGRNFVLNRSLRGLLGTAPFKWNGRNASLAEQCGPRFAKVLTRADPFPEDALADVVAYLESLPAPPPDPRAGRALGHDTGAAARGRAIFERRTRRDGSPLGERERCVTCHPPPHYTNRARAGVGTDSPYDTTGTFDVPHLTGIGSKAPYLHDGRAQSLEAIWTAPGVDDLHGAVTDLTKPDLNDLVEFLKGL